MRWLISVTLVAFCVAASGCSMGDNMKTDPSKDRGGLKTENVTSKDKGNVRNQKMMKTPEITPD